MKKWLALLLALLTLFSCAAVSYAAGLAAVCDERVLVVEKGKYGYKDITGKMVIKPQYVYAEVFHNGYAVTMSGGEKYAYIDAKGKTAIKSLNSSKKKYVYYPWSGTYGIVGVRTVNKEKEWAASGANYITSAGKLLLKEDVQYAGAFSEGFAVVGTFTISGNTYFASSSNLEMDVSSLTVKGKYSGTPAYYFIDEKGKTLSSNTWSGCNDFHEGMAAVSVTAGNAQKWGFVDTTGELAINPIYSAAGDFSNGLAPVCKNDKYGYIDASGKTVIPFEYDLADAFDASGKAIVKQDGVFFLIDASGDRITKDGYAGLIAYNGGKYYRASLANGIYGVIDAEGNTVVPQKYSWINYSSKCDVFVCSPLRSPIIVDENGKFAAFMLIDGKLPTEMQYSEYPAGTACYLMKDPVMQPDCWFFVVDPARKISMNHYYDKPEGESFSLAYQGEQEDIYLGDGTYSGRIERGRKDDFTDDLIVVEENGLYGFADLTGQIVIEPQYTATSVYHEGYILAGFGNNWVALDSKGNKVS